MPFDTFIRHSVGADLSRPAPIYRPRWISRYPDEHVKQHFRSSVDVPLSLTYLVMIDEVAERTASRTS